MCITIKNKILRAKERLILWINNHPILKQTIECIWGKILIIYAFINCLISYLQDINKGD